MGIELKNWKNKKENKQYKINVFLEVYFEKNSMLFNDRDIDIF